MDPRRVWCLSGCAFLLAGLMGFAAPVAGITISAPAFAEGKPIPARYAYKGQNISPELRIGNVPVNARSLVLIVDDPDAPMGLWTHWLVWNLSPNTTTIPEGKLPSDAREGKNSFGNVRYDGPAPPSGTHRYFFRLYALDTPFFPIFRTASNRAAMLAEMEGHVVGKAETYGVYSASQ
jgi:Raf kinase inhibitor-like YbhB/YbcL family protein